MWFDKCEAGIEVCLGQVSITEAAWRSTHIFLGRSVGDNAGVPAAMRSAALPAAAVRASVTCSPLPPPHGLRGWSFWGIAGVGHHVFVVVREDLRIHVLRTFVRAASFPALAMYMQRATSSATPGAAWQFVASPKPGFVVGKLSDDVEEVDPGDDLVEVPSRRRKPPPSLPRRGALPLEMSWKVSYQGDSLELDESNATASRNNSAGRASEPVPRRPVDAEMTVAPPPASRCGPSRRRRKAAGRPAPFKPQGPRLGTLRASAGR